MPNNREQQITQNIAIGLDKAETSMTFISRFLSDLSIALHNTLALNNILAVIPYLAVFIIALLLMIDTINLALDDRVPISTRIIKGTLAAAILFTAILTLAIAAVYLGYIITAAVAARRVWDAGYAFFNWLTITPTDDNHKKELRGAVAEKCHMVLMSTLTIVGLVLIANPVTFFAGLGILLGVAAYLVLDKFEINPLRYLGNLIFNHPFKVTEKTEQVETKIIELHPHSFNTKSIMETCEVTVDTKKTTIKDAKPTVKTPAVKKPPVYDSIFGERIGSKVMRLHETPRIGRPGSRHESTTRSVGRAV